MIILTGILGLIVGLLLFINSLLKDAIKVGDTKKLKKD